MSCFVMYVMYVCFNTLVSMTLTDRIHVYNKIQSIQKVSIFSEVILSPTYCIASFPQGKKVLQSAPLFTYYWAHHCCFFLAFVLVKYTVAKERLCWSCVANTVCMTNDSSTEQVVQKTSSVNNWNRTGHHSLNGYCIYCTTQGR